MAVTLVASLNDPSIEVGICMRFILVQLVILFSMKTRKMTVDFVVVKVIFPTSIVFW